jgi:hypothetical protein
MPLSEEQLNICDSILNRIATELVLASPGRDDGLVPVYSLVNEVSGLADGNDANLHQACINVRRALDELLDQSHPFDERTLEYVNNFTVWAQDGLLTLRNGGILLPFGPAPWLEGDDDMGLSLRENACNDIINRMATELVLANAGSDDGLVPIYSLTNELVESSTISPSSTPPPTTSSTRSTTCWTTRSPSIWTHWVTQGLRRVGAGVDAQHHGR